MCIFCQIAAGEVASDIVYQDEDIVAFNDINPEAPVHILIIPKRHLSNLNEATAADAELLGKIVLTASRLAKEREVEQTGYRLVANTGPQAGQTVHHLHFHLLAGRHFSWPPG
jgi:histidine triad (HIT) family protein